MHDPVIILAPARSFTSVVCAMLGQHPDLYDVPEVNLFVAETMRGRKRVLRLLPQSRNHGLLRAVAQLFAGEQTIETVAFARRWINLRMESPCVAVFRELAEKARPRTLVDKSHTTLRHPQNLQRIIRSFPGARFVHLLRHPRTQGESLWKLVMSGKKRRFGPSPQELDPQKRWYGAHMKILAFLEGLPDAQQIRVRGEDLLARPDAQLRQILEWLNLSSDQEAVEVMKHPETSPFSSFGPDGARAGSDPKFMASPSLRPIKNTVISLEGPVSWGQDRGEFLPEVKRLARRFGYS